MQRCQATEDFFRARLDQMIDLRHSLAVLASRMPWQAIEASCAHLFARKARVVQPLVELDLFGEQVALAPRLNAAGRPRVPLRVMIGLLYLKHAFDESDEAVVQRWAENPYWQYFCGMAYFEPKLPCDATTLIKFRGLLGEEGCEEILAQTLNMAVGMELIEPKALERVIVDTTVQEKNITHPTDSKLLETARAKLVQVAQGHGVELKQTFAKEGRRLGFKAARYAHARQFRRMRAQIRRQRTIVARLAREIERKFTDQLSTPAPGALATAVQEALGKARRIVEQTGRNNTPRQASSPANQQTAQKPGPKLYSWHEPQVECIAKGKSKAPYEFGIKASIATTLQGNLVVGARAFAGNPYDGHTLAEQLEQCSVLMQDIKGKQDQPITPKIVIADLGYRGQDQENPEVRIIHRGKFKSLSAHDKTQLKRRQAIEPIIGHLKADHGLKRNFLKGERGDKLHVILCAAGYNIRWLLRNIAQNSVLHAFFTSRSSSAMTSKAAQAPNLCANWLTTPVISLAGWLRLGTKARVNPHALALA
jgi:transposase, IS5 family